MSARHGLFAALLLLSLGAIAAPEDGHGATIDLQAQDPRTRLDAWLFHAARRGDTEVLGEYVSSGYDLDRATPEGYTPLILAAYNGQRPAVELLLRAGADPCARDRRGNTALMGAIFKGELGIARRLIGTGCSPDQRNAAGQTPAMYAALFGRVEMLRELQQAGADLDLADAQGNTAASLARGEFRGQAAADSR